MRSRARRPGLDNSTLAESGGSGKPTLAEQCNCPNQFLLQRFSTQQPIIKQVRFPKYLNETIRRHERHPSRCSNRQAYSTKAPEELFLEPHIMKVFEEAAQVEAWQLHKELYPINSKSFRKEHESFFCEGKRDSPLGNKSTTLPTAPRITGRLQSAKPITGEVTRTTWWTAVLPFTWTSTSLRRSARSSSHYPRPSNCKLQTES